MYINNTSFGSITIDDVEYDHDVVICRDTVIRRAKKLSTRYRSLYNHTPLSREEIEYYMSICRDVEVLIIGTGHHGALPIMKDAKEYLESLGIDIVIAETPRAIEVFNDISKSIKNILAILHVTC